MISKVFKDPPRTTAPLQPLELAEDVAGQSLGAAPCSARLLKAAKEADWMQVVYNQGPPCFHLDDDRFCLRAERWDGHRAIHEYVSLESLLRSIAPNGKVTHGGESETKL